MNRFLILIFLFIVSCAGASKPPFAMLGVVEPEGTPLFKKGFSQGCAAIASRRGTELFRQVYKYEYDTNYIDNPEYQFGWSRGWTNCFNAIVSGGHTLGGSADTYIFNPVYSKSPETIFTVGRASINHSINEGGNTWNNPFGFDGGGIDGIWSNVQTGKDDKQTAFGSHPLWGSWQTGQIFGLGE